MNEAATGLLALPRFRNELAQAGARAALASLGVRSTARWMYRSDRLVRNLTAISESAFDDPNAADESTSAFLTVAQSWEHLAVLQEHVESSTALINAALHYEAAGYQANASCMARLAVDESRWKSEPAFDGLISAFLQRLFLRVTTLQPALTAEPNDLLLATDGELTRRASFAMSALGLDSAARFFLTGDESHLEAATDQLALAREGLAQAGDAVAYNSIVGLMHVLPLMAERSTWRQMGDVSSSPRWHRYIKVLARGLGQNLLNARSVSELWPSQRAALNEGLLDSERSLAVRMPTSAGKTRVAEMAIVHTLATYPGAKCILIAPYRALASEIEESFANLFHDLGYVASTVPGGFDQDEMGADLVDSGDVLVLTPEKLDLLFRLGTEILNDVRLIVIDEGHIVADETRGPKFELLVSRLRRRIPQARFLMMSAVVPDATLRDFAVWLGGDDGQSVSTEWRPSILKYGRLDWDGRRGTLRFSDHDVVEGGLEFVPNLISQSVYEHVFPETGRTRKPKFPTSNNKGEVAAEVAYQFADLGPVLIFAMQTNWAESIASALLRKIRYVELTNGRVKRPFDLRGEGRALAVAREWLGEDHEVTELLARGIAFHHGRLPDAVRNSIEDDFRARRLGVIVATSTLAQGVNLPVRTVIMHSCRSRDADGSPRALSAREYWNIAGRAGRAGAETEGTVIHIASSPYDVQDFHDYAERRDNVERVESALHRMLRRLVADRISSADAAAQLDADLLALLVEEGQTALDDDDLAATFESSLFSIQARETDIPVQPLIQIMTSTARRISEDVPDVDTRRVYASTGLSSLSCQAIARHVSSSLPAVIRLLSDANLGDRDVAVDLLLDGLAEVREMEPRAALPVDTRGLLSAWLDGDSVLQISEDLGLDDPQDVTEFVEDAFSYRLPWGASGYLRVASAMTDTTVASTLAANLPGMIKYGVPSPEAAWAMSAGIASRGAAMAVAGEYLRSGEDRSAPSFRRWLGRLDPEALAERLGFRGAELESTARAVLRSHPNDLLSALDEDGALLPMTATCRPTRAAIDTGVFYELTAGDPVDLVRDRESIINRNAVLVRSEEDAVGYLDLDAARALGPELDAGLRVIAEIRRVILEPGEPPSAELVVREDLDPTTDE